MAARATVSSSSPLTADDLLFFLCAPREPAEWCKRTASRGIEVLAIQFEGWLLAKSSSSSTAFQLGKCATVVLSSRINLLTLLRRSPLAPQQPPPPPNVRYFSVFGYFICQCLAWTKIANNVNNQCDYKKRGGGGSRNGRNVFDNWLAVQWELRVNNRRAVVGGGHRFFPS